MIQLRPIRPLYTSAPAEEGRPSFVAAASGLVHHRGAFYVVADDEQSLACFPEDGSQTRWIRLLGGDLPLDPELRKAMKADFETLTVLPPYQGAPAGAMFAVGSGSHPRRRSGALLPLDPDRRPEDSAALPVKVDLRPLYDALQGRVGGALNVEGAVVLGSELVLLQRGTPGRTGNALAVLDLAGALKALEAKAAWGPALLRQVVPVDLPKLPELRDAALGFTDGIAHGPDRILFTAVAEQTDDPYRDGPFGGSVVGLVSREGKVLGIAPTAPAVKVEGLARAGDRLWLVSDEDRPDVVAQLFNTELPPFAR